MDFNQLNMSVKKLTFVILYLTVSTVNAKIKESATVIIENPIKAMPNSVCKDNLNTQIYVQKRVLSNGMTILVRPVHTLPKVSIQLWYGVGSKDEENHERGIAHLIEHMIFKGTSILSESDINVLTHQLSGSCNAFTSYDYTGYLFNFPTQHWKEALPVMADCMVNCSFKDDMLNSEMKAVIQELKMGRDQYLRTLFYEIISGTFPDHPYHHPVIGYKQDLWTVSSKDLHAFYRKHYVPNNATLVVVGDVEVQEVFNLAEQHFGAIKADPNYKHPKTYFNKDILSRSVTIYRDVQQPMALYSFIVPGIKEKRDYALQALSYIIGRGKSSRLHIRLVEERQLATSVDCFYDDLFDHGLFIIICEPRRTEDIEAINNEVTMVIDELRRGVYTDDEITKAEKLTQMSLYSLLENIEQQAYEIGKYFVATGDENFAFTYVQKSTQDLKKEVHQICSDYLRPTVMHKGFVLPLPASERENWKFLQQESDKEDFCILQARKRDTDIEPPRYACSIRPKPFSRFNFPKATVYELSNGLKLFSYYNNNTPKVTIILDFKFDATYDPSEKLGLGLFMSKMLEEGTTLLTSQEFAHALENRGIAYDVGLGHIEMSLLAEDLEFALEILNQVVTSASFNEIQVEKVREQLLVDLKNFWDNPKSYALQKTEEIIYAGHPYNRNALGTIESIQSITREDLINFYRKYVSPHKTRLAIVGNFNSTLLKSSVEQHLGNWQGPEVADIVFPPLQATKPERKSYYLNRDQISLVLGRLSIRRLDPDFDKLLLFDQILSGGALGSLHSRLYQLRERFGFFYNIGGSTITGALEEPGMFLIKTMVSLDKLQEAEREIIETLRNIIATLTPEEVDEAKRAIESSILDYFASNHSIALVFLFLDRFKLPANFFDTRAASLSKITLQEVQEAARKIVTPDQLLVVTVGRVENKNHKHK